jgi:hypothetical protein
VQGAPLEPVSPYPAADVLKVFQGDPAAGAFGFAHHVLRDLVVDVGHHPVLTPGKAAQHPPRRSSPLLLQPSALPVPPLPEGAGVAVAADRPWQGGAGQHHAVGGDRQVRHPLIHPDEAADRLTHHRLGQRYGDLQPHPAPADQVRLPAWQRIHGLEVFWPAGVGEGDAAGGGPQRHDAGVAVEAHQPGVVGDGAVRAEDVGAFLAGPPVGVGGGDSGDGPYGGLRAEPGHLPAHLVVGQPVQLHHREDAVLPGQAGDDGGRLITQQHRCGQRVGLCRGGREPQLHDGGQAVPFGGGPTDRHHAPPVTLPSPTAHVTERNRDFPYCF